MSIQGDSRPSTSSEGSAFPWILEHLLAYPASYEIPLRTMYTLNSNPRAQPVSATSPTIAYPTSRSPTSPNFPIEDASQANAAAVQFKANLMSHIAQLPSQPCSLPPSFVTSFVRRCFPAELEQVDFPQALTALDYLKDLETRRRKDVVAALTRLGVVNARETERKELERANPGVMKWVESIENKERKAQALYTQVYLGLRQWTLINEMMIEPFNKANCVAMLNTLYPPVITSQPTPVLTKEILTAQRNGFFRYITSVERNGPDILSAIIEQGKRPGEENGWPAARDVVDKYLRAANAIIDECFEITGREALDPKPEQEERKGRKVDSGISFSSSHRPSTSSSATSSTKGREKPLPSAPNREITKSGGSTLEKIAREIRRMRSRPDIGDHAKKEGQQKTVKSKPSLRKMKSAAALGERDRNLPGSRDGPSTPTFDVEEMRRERLLYEARAKKDSRHSSHSSYEL